ncbi:hypothetical protein ASF49_16730 [Methylobacterium sp. Leaf104]|uniref:hypothetical protein n=1 Tax=Methylobacterium TaxID=407 RepID=UPI0006F90451|nr:MULTISPECIES: hypothetical protein [Methylobacterium]KQP41424.1 hypothetical protein ASF49_16730 [Methylobacterium sp. Leaf104]MCI9881603.1 hypothetical protein [Methylobacterium goesingense]
MSAARRATDAGAGPIPDLVERLGEFRSLGVNCEFGFVQRYSGAEPSGLLRFAYTPIESLIHGLRTNFEAYGSPGDLHVSETPEGHYYCASRRYAIWNNTGYAVGAIDPEILLEKEYGRVAHLRTRMLSELASGAKILVRKFGPEDSEATFAELTEAIWAHGPSTVLRVVEHGPDWQPTPVRRLSEQLLEGAVRRFAPRERAYAVDLEPWVRVCDSAYAARHGLREADLYEGRATPVSFPDRIRRHQGKDRAPLLTAFTRGVDPAAFEGTKLYTFAAWVWIPDGCAATRILAAAGNDIAGHQDADLTIRNRWQRVWASGRFRPAAERAPVGLGMIGTDTDRFYSWGGALHEGPVPPPAAPPAFPVRASPFWRVLERARSVTRRFP